MVIDYDQKYNQVTGKAKWTNVISKWIMYSMTENHNSLDREWIENIDRNRTVVGSKNDQMIKIYV